MVSNITYQSSKNISIRGKSPFKVMVVASLILIIIALKPEITFFMISSAYVVLGLLEAIPGFHKILHIFRIRHEPNDNSTKKGTS
jgi:hypothetical protein